MFVPIVFPAMSKTASTEPDSRLMLSVTTNQQIATKLSRLVSETGMSKKRIVNLGIAAFEKLTPKQRGDLNKQFFGGAA